MSLFRVIKTEYNEEYLMKRFGGFEFLPGNNSGVVNVLSEALLNQLLNVINRTNQSVTTIDVAKVADLFRIYPPQISVNIYG